jgi:hypothetical protein
MTYFNHGEWESIRAALELHPLPAWAPDVVSRLLAGETFLYPAPLSYEQAVLLRLRELDLIEDVDDDDWFDGEPSEFMAGPSWMLRAIEARGLIGELLGEGALA